MRRSIGLACFVLALAAPLAVAGQASDKPGGPAKAAESAVAGPKDRTAGDLEREATAADIERGWARASAEEREVVTHHQVTTAAGQVLHYAATAGTLTIRDQAGKPIASVFAVAYTLDGADPRRRPVTFFFNGGPGSSSMWLHMASLAPVRIVTGDPQFIRPPPYAFGPNPQTLLDKSDLVFVDAIGTGYSRALGDTEPKTFWGVDPDVDAFAKAIFRWVGKNERWASPKFLYGESYGTPRAAALSWVLQDRGMALTGVILQSSILNYGVRQPGYDERFIGYLPTYAAAAWYHKKLANPPADVETAIAAARDYALGPYAAALAKGQTIAPAERDAVAQRLSELIGLSPRYIEEAKLRVEPGQFRKELLRDERLTLGRYDARYTGVDANAVGVEPDYDASSVGISGAVVGSLQDYLGRELGWKTDMDYRPTIFTEADFKWDYKHKAPRTLGEQAEPDTALDLGQAMRDNPYLQVLSLNGVYDLATPFALTEFDLSHMMLEPAAQKNLAFRYYPAGHMIYLNPDALRQLHADLAAFYDEASQGATSGAPPAGEPRRPSRADRKRDAGAHG